MLTVRKLREDKKDIRKFIDLAFEIYKNDDKWVAPLKSDLIKTLIGTTNPLLKNGEHAYFMVFEDEKAIARIMVGIDETLNTYTNKKHGYFALFECYDDLQAAKMAFDAAYDWIKERKMDKMVGPVSPTGGDDSKGVLVKGFDGPAVLLNSYNQPYYADLYEKCGLTKYEDHLAYLFKKEDILENKELVDRVEKIVERIKERYDIAIDRIDLKQEDREVQSVNTIFSEGVPEGWDYTPPMTKQSVRDELKNLRSFYTNRFCFIARANGRPIGFVIGLPDYNQVLIKMKGRLFPTGVFKYLFGKKKINGARIFVQFVVKDYQNKGVNNCIFYEVYKDFMELGYDFMEGSTIGERNLRPLNAVENMGGKLYRIYREYQKDII